MRKSVFLTKIYKNDWPLSHLVFAKKLCYIIATKRNTKPLNRHTSSKFPITYSLGRINQRMPNGKQFEFRQRSEAETAESEVTQ